MDILIKAAQFVLSLSLLIVAHEMGHFLFAKLFKTRVEKFYLFFDPWFSLFKIKKGETEYGIGWLPFGGYVKISGMIDESMDKEQMAQPPQPWEFRTKPAWQRLLIMVGGVTVNFIMAFFIYAMILFTWGQEYVPVKNAAYGFEFCETALKNGFRNGDRIIAVDGVEYEMMADVTNHIVFDNAQRVTVERDGQQMDLVMPADLTAQFLAANEKMFALMRYPWVVDRTVSGSSAEKAGLTSGDVLVAVNGTPTSTADLFVNEIKSNTGKVINLTINRNGAEQTVNMQVAGDSTIGVYCQRPEMILHAQRKEFGFWESFPAGFNFGVNTLTKYVKNLKLIFTREGVKQVGGFIAIGNIFPAVWDWQAFWSMTAFLSIILAFMNILPIPALDGGHVLFLLYEIITGRKPSDKFLERAQVVGMFLLLGLLVLANGNDIIRLFSK
jgi:regulator of sigma E protease